MCASSRDRLAVMNVLDTFGNDEMTGVAIFGDADTRQRFALHGERANAAKANDSREWMESVQTAEDENEKNIILRANMHMLTRCVLRTDEA